MNVKLESSWKAALLKEFSKSYFKELTNFVLHSYRTTKVYPPASLIFNALDSCPLTNTSVVILGQDPYHGPGQAHGLSFSVPENIKPPPSLLNIYKELQDDLKKEVNYNNGNLDKWAKQGVFLLNTTLTVEKSKPLSHQKFGWDIFTDKVISVISNELENIVFILWGSFAQSKKEIIDSNKHLILSAPHPSPLSAHRGFFGSKPFSKTNTFLKSKQIDMVEW